MSESEPYDPMERASRDELGAVQPARLRGTLAHVHEHVPHYRAPLDAAGVHPEDCRALEDLARFPFTTKQDLRENYPFGMLAVPRERVVRVHASSGTTDTPLRSPPHALERSVGKARRVVDQRRHQRS
jgi:phenylacetate-CoA ligase